MLRRAGYHPATLLGLVGTVSLMVGAYNKGVAALPLVLVLITAFTLIWYLFGIERGSPVAGTAATLLTVGWVSLLGAYAGLLLSPSTFPDRHGIAFLLGAIIATVANDVGALVVGGWMGRHPLAPTVSPNKTWEGLAGGTVFTILVSTVIVGRHPPVDTGQGRPAGGGGGGGGTDRRSLRIPAQAGSPAQGHGYAAAGARRRARPGRRADVRASRHLLSGPRPQYHLNLGQAREMATSVSLIGSTGSIGTQALEVIDACPERFEVVALGANRSVDVLATQAARLRPQVVAIGDPTLAKGLASSLPRGIEVVAGPDGLASIATVAEVAVNGIVGFAGLTVTLAALEAGRRLALANKESIIAGAPVVQRARRTTGAEIIPVDSEHCALHQCLRAGRRTEVTRLLLTASGGPFRGLSREQLASVGVAEALVHPTWSMGPKITVDSSTLMNKGLEVIEAHELFGIPYDAIDVLIHPQSIVHSMVEYSDGAVVAQLSMPDMRLPIGYALSYPDRLSTAFGPIDWVQLSSLEFEPPDRTLFPSLDIAFRAGRAGDLAPAWLNAANEVAVEAFLAGRIPWNAIAEVVDGTLDRYDGSTSGSVGDPEAPVRSVDDVLDADAAARRVADVVVAGRERAA